MKRHLVVLLTAMLTLSGCGIVSSGLNTASLVNAAGAAATALSITDEQIAELSAQSVAYMDSVNTV